MDTTRDFKFIPSSSTVIRRIEAKYTDGEVFTRGVGQRDTTSEIDIGLLYIYIYIQLNQLRPLGPNVPLLLVPPHRIHILPHPVSESESLK